MTMTSFDPSDAEDQRQWRRRKSDQPQPWRSVGWLTVALTIVSLIFTAGYNWRSVAIVEQNQDNFVRKDVQGYQLQNVNDQLSEIRRQLESNQKQMDEIRADVKKATSR